MAKPSWKQRMVTAGINALLQQGSARLGPNHVGAVRTAAMRELGMGTVAVQDIDGKRSRVFRSYRDIN